MWRLSRHCGQSMLPIRTRPLPTAGKPPVLALTICALHGLNCVVDTSRAEICSEADASNDLNLTIPLVVAGLLCCSVLGICIVALALWLAHESGKEEILNSP
eukprot:gene3686-4109_t